VGGQGINWLIRHGGNEDELMAGICGKKFCPNKHHLCHGCALEQNGRLVTALRRIKALGEKNVDKYAQEIAREALEWRQ